MATLNGQLPAQPDGAATPAQPQQVVIPQWMVNLVGSQAITIESQKALLESQRGTIAELRAELERRADWTPPQPPPSAIARPATAAAGQAATG